VALCLTLYDIGKNLKFANIWAKKYTLATSKPINNISLKIPHLTTTIANSISKNLKAIKPAVDTTNTIRGTLGPKKPILFPKRESKLITRYVKAIIVSICAIKIKTKYKNILKIK